MDLSKVLFQQVLYLSALLTSTRLSQYPSKQYSSSIRCLGSSLPSPPPCLLFKILKLIPGNPDEMKAFSSNILDANLIKFQTPN